MSDNEKYFLDEPGLEKLVDFIKTELSNKVNIGDQISLPEDLVKTADLEDYINNAALLLALADYAKKSDIPAEQDLSNYATTNDLQQAINQILQEVSGVYHFRGNVDNLAELQAIENPEEGDVYNIRDTGMNAAWTGESWDDFGSIADLSPYALREEIQPIAISDVYRILYSGNKAVVPDAESLYAMVANTEPQVEIILNKNMNLSNAISVPAGKEVSLDLNGKTIDGNVQTLVNVAGGSITIKNGTITGTNRTVVVTGGELVLEDANIVSTSDCAISATGTESSVVINDGHVVAQEAGVLVTSGASLEINGGEIEGIDNGPVMGNGTAGQGNVNVVMNGGKLIAHIQTAGYVACGVYMPNSGSFTMNDGEIISDGAGIVMRGGQVNLNGGKITATGPSGVTGKVGDSRVVVGPYAVVYDVDSKYPASDTLELNIKQNNVILSGTDGAINVIPSNFEANINYLD